MEMKISKERFIESVESIARYEKWKQKVSELGIEIAGENYEIDRMIDAHIDTLIEVTGDGKEWEESEIVKYIFYNDCYTREDGGEDSGYRKVGVVYSDAEEVWNSLVEGRDDSDNREWSVVE